MLRGGAAEALRVRPAVAAAGSVDTVPDMDRTWSEAEFAAALESARRGAIAVPGVALRGDQLEQLVRSLPLDDDGNCHASRIDLDGATIQGDCTLTHLVVEGPALFRRASFRGHVELSHADFRHGASFKDATFQSADFGESVFTYGWFSGARFTDEAEFAAVACTEEARFDGVRFDGSAGFDGARIATGTFSRARFDRPASFQDAVLGHRGFGISFQDAEFRRDVSFYGAEFDGQECNFFSVRFEAAATFSLCRFGCPTGFGGSQFGASPLFNAVTFRAVALFDGVAFEGGASFEGARFEALASFAETVFGGGASFRSVDVASDLELRGARFAQGATFRRARLRDARQLGPMTVDGDLSFALATFDEITRIETDAQRIACDGAVFRAGVDLRARRGTITAEGTDFAAASLIGPLDASAPGDAPARSADQGASSDGPRFLSLRNAKVAHLTISGMDLSGCRFLGAHGLDGLRMERVRLDRTPGGWALRRPPRWTARRILVEERDWRASRRGGGDWNGRRNPAGAADVEADQVASLYRALRKGLEDQRDAPGAADFYYGEMEMRRMYGSRTDHAGYSHVRPVRSSERAILWSYWAAAGYGLRATRAFAALALTIALLAVPLALWGFHPDRSYGRAVLFAAESSVSLLHAPRAQLSAGGEIVDIALRLAGPLFFGLAVLALRSRVKR
jgi:uncharacterized protein YjbI with pentapeptide repeats